MQPTPQDWRVTASLEARRAVTELRVAMDDPMDTEAPVLDLVDVVAHLWCAARAANAAVGALVAAEIQAGTSWEELAAALDFPGADEARAALTPAMELGRGRMHDRLPYA
jgi:hypothetical protein